MTSRADNRSGGFAQVLVLTSLATISALVTIALLTATQSGAFAIALDHQIRGDLATGSAIRRIIAAVEDPQDDLETRVLSAGAPYVLDINGTQVEVEIQGEAGKLNPVRSSSDSIAKYIANVQLPDEDRRALLNELAEARRTSDAAAAIGALHRNLLLVASLALFESDFSIWNQTEGIDPLYANERVLAAIPDLTPAGIAKVMELRQTDPSGVRSMSAYFSTGRAVFSLVATTRSEQGGIHQKRTPIEISTAGQVVLLEPHF